MATKRRRARIFPRVTPDELRRLMQLLPPREFQTTTAHAYEISVAVIRKFLGFDWIRTHVGAPTGFLRRDESTAQARETWYMRTTVLAEMLYNLQIVEGFDNCLAELDGGQLESAYAALEIARMLVTQAIDSSVTFYFVTPRRGRSYDLYITLSDGGTIRAETKCKLEETEISLETVKQSLQYARKRQLPKTRPGVIFIKVPRPWLDQSFAVGLEQLTDRFLAQTGRVVSVIYYTTQVIVERVPTGGELIRELIQYNEYPNPHHRFPKLWKRENLFPETPAPAPPRNMSYNGLPRTWQRWFSP